MGRAIRLEALRERTEESPDIDEADREVLLDFSDELYLLNTTYTDIRHEKLLRHCVIIAEQVGGLADALHDREAAEPIVRWINRNYDNEETNRDYRVAFRVFGRRATDDNGDEPPESIDWVPSGTSKSYKPKPNPRDMLHWEDHVVPMIDATQNPRDAAMIAVAFDAGARSGEFKSLEYRDVTDHKHGFQITVDGKQGERTVTLIPSVPHLQRWRAEHPNRDTPSGALWCNLSTGASISNHMFKKALESAAERAGVTRPVTLTNFRKSSASYLASKGMSQSHLERHHGWVRGSNVASRYVAVFGDDADNELARIHGLDVEDDEPEPIGPVVCPRCDKETPREKEFCVWCEQALDQEAVNALEADEDRARRDLLRYAKENPDVVDETEVREAALSMMDDNPDLHPEVRKFLNALDDGAGDH